MRLCAIALALTTCTSALCVNPRVRAYRVSPDLREVRNLRQFKLTPEMRRKLIQNLFVVIPADHEQPCFVYEDNDYHDIPSFVTIDSALHLYHLVFMFTLRRLEERKLFPLVCKLTDAMLKQSIRTYKSISDAKLKRAALRNVAYFGVAARLLRLKSPIPKEAKSMVARELQLIGELAGWEQGAIFPYKFDYSQFRPRGHYTRNENLKRYFKGMMWYGLVPLSPERLIWADGEEKVRPELCKGVARQALLIVHDLYAAKLTKQWSDLFEPVNYFVGFADDLTPAELKQIMDRVFGRNATFDDYRNPSKFEAFIKGFMSARAPRIRHKFAFVTPGLLPVATPDIPQFRFMGQRYIPDSEILQRLSEPGARPVPKGLDVMAVLGSPRAIRLLDVFYREPQTWDKYVAERNKLIREFGQLPQDKWTSNMYWGWLWVLKSIIKPYGEGYPSFMRNNSWQDKCLSTALASWAQLRHDTILYAKQSLVAAECGGGERPPKAKGYVEPVPEAFRRLLHLVQLTRKLLTPRGFMTREMSDKLAEFEDMLEFLQRVATKELEGRRLTADEYDQIRLIGSWMEILSLWVMSDGKAKDWYEIQPATDRDMACIADVHTAIDRRPNGLGEVCLEEGVGHAHEIFVIVPIEGELYLTRGAVFSYYEFLQPMRKRLTDEEWQRMLKEGRAPKQPGWTKFFMAKPPKRDVIVAQGRYWGC